MGVKKGGSRFRASRFRAPGYRVHLVSPQIACRLQRDAIALARSTVTPQSASS